MTKPWHHFRILCYCLIVLYLLSLDKHISDNSEDSVYNLTSPVVTSQLVIDWESNIPFLCSPPTLFVPPPEIWRHLITAVRAQHQSWSHIFLPCSIQRHSDSTLTPLCLYSINLQPLTSWLLWTMNSLSLFPIHSNHFWSLPIYFHLYFYCSIVSLEDHSLVTSF